MSFVGGCSRHQARRLLMWGLTQGPGGSALCLPSAAAPHCAEGPQFLGPVIAAAVQSFIAGEMQEGSAHCLSRRGTERCPEPHMCV